MKYIKIPMDSQDCINVGLNEGLKITLLKLV